MTAMDAGDRDGLRDAAAPVQERAHAAHGYDADRKAILARLRRIEGQVGGLGRMVEDDRYCIDVLTQIGATMTALESVALRLLDGHTRHCVAGALASGDAAEATAKVEELVAAVQRFAKAR